MFLGLTQQFTATVTGASNTAVTWSVNGTPGGNASIGLVDAQGLYTAPADLPSPTVITVSATTQAAPAKSSSAQITLLSDISVGLAPPAPSVELGAAQKFSASISSAGKPDTTIRWSLAGTACPSACGSMDSLGNYTAPQDLPASANVSVVATSAADSSRQSTATVHLTSSFTLTLAGPASLPTAGFAQITATGSNPNPALARSLSGPGCSSSACGVLSPSTFTLSNGGAFATSASYAAPSIAPSPANVNITVTSVADSPRSATPTISPVQVVSVVLSPASVARASLWVRLRATNFTPSRSTASSISRPSRTPPRPSAETFPAIPDGPRFLPASFRPSPRISPPAPAAHRSRQQRC